ncbi:MAG: hypothetical protein E6J64_00825 [Deltaproteobacteria bacterium]|nr:MAG: hypothetical protein E6J64_00825 [Deltaproteobacteria bacterium]
MAISIHLKVYEGGKLKLSRLFRSEQIRIGSGSCDLVLEGNGILPSHAVIDAACFRARAGSREAAAPAAHRGRSGLGAGKLARPSARPRGGARRAPPPGHGGAQRPRHPRGHPGASGARAGVAGAGSAGGAAGAGAARAGVAGAGAARGGAARAGVA